MLQIRRLHVRQKSLFLYCLAIGASLIFTCPNAWSKGDRAPELIRAIRDGENKKAEKLINKNRDINARDSYGWTPLMYAVFRSDEGLIGNLLSHGAEMNLPDQDGVTPLIASIMLTPQPFMVQYLPATETRACNVAPLLIEKGADPNQPDNDGNTPLIYAVIGSQEPIVEALIRKGADPNRPDRYGRTPLFFILNPDKARIWSPADGALSSRYRVKRQSDESRYPSDYARAVAKARDEANIQLVEIKIRISELLRRSGAKAPDPDTIRESENHLTEAAPQRMDIGMNDPLSVVLGGYFRSTRRSASYRMLVRVARDGKVTKAVVLYGMPGGFSEELQKTALKLKYRPAVKNGLSVESWDTIYGYVARRDQIFRPRP